MESACTSAAAPTRWCGPARSSAALAPSPSRLRRSVPAPRRLMLRLGDHIGRLQFWLRRYGALYLQDQLARKLGLHRLQRSALERMQAVDVRHLK